MQPISIQTHQILRKIFYWTFTRVETEDLVIHRGLCRRDIYISVIQKLSFLSPPITHSGSVRCQLRPDPTVADPIITGCNNTNMWHETGAVKNIKKIMIWAVKSIWLTCGWPRWWMSNWLLIFPGHPVVAKRFSLARDHLRRRITSVRMSSHA